jgi:hypothetical protein
MDLNHRPLPYQGSALTELSYTPSYPRNASTPERLPQLRPDGEPAGERYSVSRSVTSTPPTRCAVRLYTTEPTVAKAVIRNTLSTPRSAV